MRRATISTLAAAAPLLLAGCMVGPDYVRPAAPAPPAYKEAAGWRRAQPQQAASGQPWWSVYDDPVLDRLERAVEVSNQTLLADEAAYRQAVAIVDETRATLFPTLGAGASASRSSGRGGSGRGGSTPTTLPTTGTGTGTTAATATPTASSSGIGNLYSLSASASWAPDIWGKVRRAIAGGIATAQAAAADIAAVRLTAQATLAIDYFELRSADRQKRLLDDTIAAYRRSLQITRNQYAVGVVAKSDVITAQTQLQAAQAQEINTGVQRAQLEHAIAVLTGQPPAALTLVPTSLTHKVPVAPTGIASALLQRRPDIAEAERKMASANEQIGIAVAAYYPDITLSGSYGFSGSPIGALLDASNDFWSIGSSLSETIFDAGARGAQVAAARAGYDQTVATYRQTVLAGFQQVEDELAALRILEQEATIEDSTVRSAEEAVRLVLNQYRAGTLAYTAVVTAQATALSAEQNLLTIRQNRLVASVTLIEALGGGWNAGDLPQPGRLAAGPQTAAAKP